MTKVKKIIVQNVKAITNLELNLNGATAIVFGANNKGKTTLLRALKDRLLKLKADILVRQGETEGKYIMEFTTGEIIEWDVTTKTKAGERLTLISTDGSKTSVISDIIKWFDPNNFDIDKFLNESPAKQRKTLQDLCGLDFTTLDEKYAEAYQERTFANRDVDILKAKLKDVTININLPAEPIPTGELEKELLTVESHNKTYELLSTQANNLEDTIQECVRERQRLESVISSFKEKEARLDSEVIEINKKLDDPVHAPKTLEQIENIKLALDGFKAQNALISNNNFNRENLKAMEVAQDIAFEKDIAVKDIDKKKDDMIRSANLPEGFGFGDEGITYNGLPVTREQLSSSTIYIAALKLAAIKVGHVRMLHFDASFLDKHSLAEVQAWAESEDLQLLIERADYEGNDIRYEIIEEDWMK